MPAVQGAVAQGLLVLVPSRGRGRCSRVNDSLAAGATAVRFGLLGTACLLVLAGCTAARNAIDCGHLYGYVQMPSRNAAIVQWADTHVLGRPLSAFEYNGGLLAGPGRWKLRHLQGLPDGLAGSEVRVLQEGADGRISAIFIGRRSLKGLWITRGRMPEALPDIPNNAQIAMYRGRVALQCYQQR